MPWRLMELCRPRDPRQSNFICSHGDRMRMAVRQSALTVRRRSSAREMSCRLHSHQKPVVRTMATSSSRYHLSLRVACLLIIGPKPVVAHDGQIHPLPFDEDVSLSSRRLPPTRTKKPTNEALKSCHAGAICAGPGKMYPIGREPGTVIQSRFVVPDFPNQYGSTQNTHTMTISTSFGGSSQLVDT